MLFDTRTDEKKKKVKKEKNYHFSAVAVVFRLMPPRRLINRSAVPPSVMNVKGLAVPIHRV